jgi:Ca2+-binding EF-hand superfamily protein
MSLGNCASGSKKSKPKPTRAGGKGKQQQGTTDEELYSVFKQFDIDGDGFIEEYELKQVMQNMGQSPAADEIKSMFKAADVDGDGRISFEEFCKISRANPLQLSLKAVFAELDLDGDGHLTTKELKQAFVRLGHDVDDNEILQIIKDSDMNADSVITFDGNTHSYSQKYMLDFRIRGHDVS